MADLFEWVRKLRNEKKEYRRYQARINQLPPDYQIVVKEIEQYLWSYARDAAMLDVLYHLMELFEEGARERRDILSITGQDVGAFCDDLLAQIQDETWTGQNKNKLNDAIRKKLGKGQQ